MKLLGGRISMLSTTLLPIPRSATRVGYRKDDDFIRAHHVNQLEGESVERVSPIVVPQAASAHLGIKERVFRDGLEGLREGIGEPITQSDTLPLIMIRCLMRLLPRFGQDADLHESRPRRSDCR